MPWLIANAILDEDGARRAQILRRMTVVMIAVALLGGAVSLFEPRNDVGISAFFYGILVVWLLVIDLLARRGRLATAVWLMTGMFWAIIAAVTLLFGGLQGQNAACFTVCVLLVGSLVSGRAAIGAAVVSSVWCGAIAALETVGSLPRPLVAYSPINAWGAVTTTLLLTSVLLHSALESLLHAQQRADRAAVERDEALRRTIQGQKMELVGNLTSSVAHDFNNLLTVVVAVADILRAEVAPEPGPTADLFDELDEATARAALLTRQLLAFGRPPKTGAADTDLAEVVRGLRPILARLVGNPIELRIDAPGPAFVRASSHGLEQIVLNLAVNAKQAMPSGGRMSIRVQATDGWVVLRSEDDGVGIDDETRARIFEPFFTTKAAGTGLGLSTVRQLVDASGGTISVESAPGRGAAFEVKLPHVAPPAGHPPRPRSLSPAVSTSGRGRRILVAEDDPLVRRSVTRWLGSDGFEVVALTNGLEALAFLRVAPDVVALVSDVAMPGMDGEELRAEAAKLRPTLPILLLSGNRAPEATGPAWHRFIPKPLNRDALRAQLDLVLDEEG